MIQVNPKFRFLQFLLTIQGQISGFLEMPNFLQLFGDKPGPAFSNVRSGTIVALLSIGTLLGALIAAPIADAIGRKYSIIFWNMVFCVGMIVQIATMNHWYQIAIGRWVAGLGVGALSVLTPMYQSETAPRRIRGALVSCYQLFITLGILYVPPFHMLLLSDTDYQF
jgi:SP family sugar:H+ symporter-like MFS transporter